MQRASQERSQCLLHNAARPESKIWPLYEISPSPEDSVVRSCVLERASLSSTTDFPDLVKAWLLTEIRKYGPFFERKLRFSADFHCKKSKGVIQTAAYAAASLNATLVREDDHVDVPRRELERVFDTLRRHVIPRLLQAL
ncbi:hypothetical protein VUR80DRAFT_5614 [Thermomyces stellatus]